MAEKRCPKCRLWNTPNAQICDCGYNFETGHVLSPIPGSEKRAGAGVGGWLAFLIIVLTVLGPLLGSARMFLEFKSVELATPDLAQNSLWLAYKASSWAIFFVTAVISISTGYALSTRFRPGTVTFAMVSLWLIGPVGSLFYIGAAFIIFGETAAESLPEMLGGVIVPIITAVIWTTYLAKSKRVKSTYFISNYGVVT